jgi:hypothetical protein
LVDGRQFETATVKRFLRTGRWPQRPNRRNQTRLNGPRRASERRAADKRLLALMAKRPKAGVRQLAAALNLTHPCVSRRIMRLKALGLVIHDETGWTIETQPAQCAPWVLSVSNYTRRETHEEAGRRFG